MSNVEDEPAGSGINDLPEKLGHGDIADSKIGQWREFEQQERRTGAAFFEIPLIETSLTQSDIGRRRVSDFVGVDRRQVGPEGVPTQLLTGAFMIGPRGAERVRVASDRIGGLFPRVTGGHLRVDAPQSFRMVGKPRLGQDLAHTQQLGRRCFEHF